MYACQHFILQLTPFPPQLFQDDKVSTGKENPDTSIFQKYVSYHSESKSHRLLLRN